MASWWMASNPEVVAVPTGEFEPGSVHDRRLLGSEQLLPGPSGRLLWSRVAEVLVVLGDVEPLSLYETTRDDITALAGPSVHCHRRAGADAVVESVDPHGWRRFTFVPEQLVVTRLLLGLATIRPSVPGRVVACTLADGRGGVLVSDGVDVLLGDLPDEPGPIRAAVPLGPEDVHLLMMARLQVPGVVGQSRP